MRSQNPSTNAQDIPRSILRSDVPGESGKNVASLAEIHQRALEIHVERGGHVCDLDNYLDEWLQAESELREKYNRSNDEGEKNK